MYITPYHDGACWADACLAGTPHKSVQQQYPLRPNEAHEACNRAERWCGDTSLSFTVIDRMELVGLFRVESYRLQYCCVFSVERKRRSGLHIFVLVRVSRGLSSVGSIVRPCRQQ